MSISLISRSWLVQIGPNAKLVLISLADRADKDGHCWPSLADTHRRTGISRRHIQRCLNDLELAGHIEIIHRPGRSSIFIVHPRLDVIGDEVAPLPPCHPTPDSESAHPRLIVTQTTNNRQETPAVPRPDLPLEANVDLLEKTHRTAEAEQLRAYILEQRERIINWAQP